MNFRKSNHKRILAGVLTTLFISTMALGQARKFENFDAEQKKYEKEEKQFLDAKLNNRNSREIFSDLQSNKSIAVNPM